MTMPSFTIRQLLESGVHFGHHTRRWNPKMTPYIFGVRNNIHIINLEETVPLLSQALSAIREVAASGGGCTAKRDSSSKTFNVICENCFIFVRLH